MIVEDHEEGGRTKEEGEAEETPQVFAVERHLTGWRFNRRDFLTAASAAAAAAVAGTVAGCGPGVATDALPAESPTMTKVMRLTRTAAPAKTAAPTRRLSPTKTSSQTKMSTPIETRAATKTPAPTTTCTPTMTLSPSPTPAPLAEFVEDVTIPDGTIVEPGRDFVKTWRVRNSGNVHWGEGTCLVFDEGDSLGANSPVSVADAKPGDALDISVDMAAPPEPGNYSSKWCLRTADGFRLTDLWVVIAVASTEPIPAGEEGIEIEGLDVEGMTRTFTLPCGYSIPPGAVCVCNCVTAPVPGEPSATPAGEEVPGEPGEVPPGEEGINFVGPDGETRTMPCGSTIPPGWTCTCNCVSVPAACSCVGHCSCDSHSSQSSHYWHPC